MSNQHEISEYIENLPLKKTFCKGYRPDEVYEAICNLSSMYNQVLSEAYEENEELKRKIEYLEKSNIVQHEPVKTEWTLFNRVEEKIPETIEKRGNEMNDKELQRLKRGELLEILLDQSRENENLKMQIEGQKREIEELKGKLSDRKIQLDKAGTIAEASFQLNGVFDAAEKAAQQYLDNLKLLYEREENTFVKKEADTETKCAALMQATQERCDFMKEDMVRQCNELEETTKRKCAELETSTQLKCSEMETSVQQKCSEMELTVKEKCEKREREAEEKCIALDQKAKADVDNRWNELSTRLEEFYRAHEGLREILASSSQILR